jgi:hypothetical protein
MSSLLLLSVQQIALTLCRIAEMRVDAQNWDLIAAQLQVSTLEVREFVLAYEEDFRKRILKVRRDQREFDGDAAYKTLRQQMTGEDEKIRHSAACTVAKLNVAEKRIRAMKPRKANKPEGCPEGFVEIAKLSPDVKKMMSDEKLSEEKQLQNRQLEYRFSYRHRYQWNLVDPQCEEPCPRCGILPSGVLPDDNHTWFFDDEARERALKNVEALHEAEKNGFVPPPLSETVTRSAMVFGWPR